MPHQPHDHVESLPGILQNAPIGPFTTFKVGGPATYLIEVRSRDELVNAIRAARTDQVPFFVLGGGSNVLVADKGFEGLAIMIRSHGVTIEGKHVIVEAGTPLQRFVQETNKAGLTGLEYMMGIPGSVGGAVAGNAGTSEKWISEKIFQVWMLNAGSEVQRISKSDCNFSYRNSRFKYSRTEIVLAAEFDLEPGSKEETRKLALQYIGRRKHQPSGDACAGCIFKNPPEMSAGKLIEQAGLKEKRIGGAYISSEHGNFIVNIGNASAEDIAILISYIKQQIRDKFGVQLQEEVRYIGF